VPPSSPTDAFAAVLALPALPDDAFAAVLALPAIPDDAVLARVASPTSRDDEVAASFALPAFLVDAAAARVAPVASLAGAVAAPVTLPAFLVDAAVVAPPGSFVDAVAARVGPPVSLAGAFAAGLAVARRESAKSPSETGESAEPVLQAYGKLPRALIAVFMSMFPFHDTGAGAFPVALVMMVTVLLFPLAKSRRFAPTPLITSVRVAGPSRVES